MSYDKDILFCLVYLAPENSPFYEGKELKRIALLENLLELNTKNKFSYP